jgi:hypothetical protein
MGCTHSSSHFRAYKLSRLSKSSTLKKGSGRRDASLPRSSGACVMEAGDRRGYLMWGAPIALNVTSRFNERDSTFLLKLNKFKWQTQAAILAFRLPHFASAPPHLWRVQCPQSSAAHRNELLTERLVRAEVSAMDTNDRTADAEFPHPDLNRMYQEVVKLRFRVRQAEAHALWPDSNTSGLTVTWSSARDDSRASAVMSSASTLRRSRPRRAVSGRRGGRPCRRSGGLSHG